MRYIIERLPSGEYVVYDETGAEVGRFDSKEAADSEFPLSIPRGVYPTWQPGQPIPEVAPTGGVTQAETVNRFWDEHPDEYNRWQQWNAQQELAGGPRLESAQAEAAFGYMEPFGLGDFGQALTLYAAYLYEPGLGIPMPTQAAQYVAEGGEVETAVARAQEQAEAWAATPAPRVMQPGVAAPPGLSAEALATPVGQAIVAVTDDPTVQAAMWAGAGLEGGQQGPWETKPGGARVGLDGEVGPWQIHPIHFDAITVEAAADPNSAALYMLPRYEDSVKSVPPELWQTNPEAALALAVANAERPGGWHEGLTAEEALAIYDPGGIGRVGAAGAAAGAGGPGAWPTGPYVPPAEEAILPTLTREQEIEAARFAVVHGMPRYAYVAAVAAGVVGEEAIIDFWLSMTDEARLIAYKQAHAPLVVREGLEWTDQDWQEAANLGLDEAALTAAARAQQTPREWWEEQRAETEAWLKEQGLTWEDLDIMQAHGIGVSDYQAMRELGMTAPQWNAALDRLGSADAIWQAAQLGYDPAVMNPAQVARYELQTDVGLQVMRAAEAIPEAVRPDIGALSPAITNRYDLRRAEARAQGRYLSPGDFLGEEYPGLFGGGTAQQLRADLEGIMGDVDTERTLTREERLAHPARARISPLGATMGAGLTRRGAGIQLPAFGARTRTGQEEQILRHMPTTTRTLSGEMLYQRAMAQAMIEAPAHRQPADIERIRARYPELARRAAAGEHETEEQRRRRRLKGRLQPAGRAPGRAGYTPPQVVNFPR